MHGKVAATGRVASIVTIVLQTGRSFDDFAGEQPSERGGRGLAGRMKVPTPTPAPPPARPFVAGRENRLVDWGLGGESLSLDHRRRSNRSEISGS